MKRRLTVPFAIAAAMATLFLSLAPASAQSIRSFVSHTGDDSNNCSATSPCASFSGALAKTAFRGEIDCLDSGSFDNVVIDRSVTIDCSGSVGGILSFDNAPGIVINFDSFRSDRGLAPHVTLRHLSINGEEANSGTPAISITGAGTGSIVSIEDCTVSEDNDSGNGSGIGISDQRGRGLLIVDNTTVQNNASGIIIQSSNNGSRRAVIRNTRVINSGTGITVGANSEVAIINSEITDNATAGLVVSASTGSATVDATAIAHNGFAFQNSGTVRLSNSNVMYNATGWTGIINTFTNNRFTNNGAVGPLVPIGSLSNPTGEQ